MYKDNNNSSSPNDIDGDIDLIADIGYIASTIRILEQTYLGGYLNVSNEQEEEEEEENKQQLVKDNNDQSFPNNSLGTNKKNKCKEYKNFKHHHHQHHHQQQQHKHQLELTRSQRKSSEDFNLIGSLSSPSPSSPSSSSSTSSLTLLPLSSPIQIENLTPDQKKRYHLENLLINFYEEYERIKQQKTDSIQIDISSDIMNKSETKLNTSTSTKISSKSNNDNNGGATSSSSGNIKNINEIKKTKKLGEDFISDVDVVVGSKSDSNIINLYHNNNKNNNNNNSKKNYESKEKSDVQFCLSGGNYSESSGSSVAKVSSIILSKNENSKNNEFKLVKLDNTITQFSFNDDDLRALVKELKKKVEYTERMNWLCLTKRQNRPPLRKCSLPKHQEVKKRFLEICDTKFSDEVKSALRLPAFDSYEWEDADVIHLMQTMFIELGLIEKFSIPVGVLREWLYEVYKHYNAVPFHNFRHCFCVAQMMYAITRQANLLSRLGDLEVLILLVSCICHDLDHPGYNNIYQINARTELALRYNDISPLENHHCSIAFRLLEHPECNIFKHFNRETFNIIREGIIRCILATDMARHNEILTQFKEIVSVFDYSNRAHINLLCMVLIKVADISNEARPMDVAEPWLDRLLQEFFAQSAAEKSEGLPVTPFMDPDKVSRPGSQVRFIGLVLLPLFEALGELLPELTELIIIPVRIALDYYKKLNDAQTKNRKSLAEPNENSSDGGGSGSPQLPRSQSGISVKSRRSIPSQKSASRTSVDEPGCVAAELHDLPEGSESGDSETATEVEVAEKASKFKVDTESGNRSKPSHTTSRKSSREKRPSMISEMCSSGGRIRNSYGNIHGHHQNRSHFGSNRAVSLDQYSSNNRRLSDGLQQVISDSNVFYNRHNRSLDIDGQSGFSGNVIDKSSKGGGGIIESNLMVVGEDVINSNTSNLSCDNSGNKQISHQQQLKQQQQQQHQQFQNKGSLNGSNNTTGSGNYSQNGTKSWKARFKQITEYFSFGFEKPSKRFSSLRSGPCSLRNNNADNSKQQGICCTISNNLSPILKQKQDLINMGRNRAYSLDVPTRQRYSSSSGGDSRKSSKNEENSNKHDLLNEDNNSNNTMMSGDPPSIRIQGSGRGNGGGSGVGGADTLDQSGSGRMSLPKVITPSVEIGHSFSATDYNLTMECPEGSGGTLEISKI